jgi:hypothetical protein
MPAALGPGHIGAGLPTSASTILPSRSSCRTPSTPSRTPRRGSLASWGQIAELVPAWSMAAVVEALQATRGISLLAAVTLVPRSATSPALPVPVS